MVKGLGEARSFRIVGENDAWKPLTFEVWSELVPLRDGKKESHCYWSLPDDNDAFYDFLRREYKLRREGFHTSNSIQIGRIQFSLYRTHNEVGESYFSTTAKMPRHILVGILNIIDDEFYAENSTTIYAPSINGGEELLRFELCGDGMFHWHGDESYAGYTEKELLEREGSYYVV